MKTSTILLSNNILLRGKQKNISISPMKLQRLLYYVCALYIKNTGASPISEQFEVWKYGPVLPTAHNKFQSYKNRPIQRLSKDVKGHILIIDEHTSPALHNAIEIVWNKMKFMSAVDLSKRTQKKGSGWYAAFQNNNETISFKQMGNDETIPR